MCIRDSVKPEREQNRRALRAKNWWRHGEIMPSMRAALARIPRYIATPRVAKHRLFVWLHSAVLPDSRLYVIARADDATFGVLHSRIHQVWALANASRHGDGDEGGRPTYNAATCFEAFPFPPGLQPNRNALTPGPSPEGRGEQKGEGLEVAAIAEAARRLNELRENWLNPPQWVDRAPEIVPGYPDRLIPKPEFAAELKKRTLTNLYNARPAWPVSYTHLDVYKRQSNLHGLGHQGIRKLRMIPNLAGGLRLEDQRGGDGFRQRILTPQLFSPSPPAHSRGKRGQKGEGELSAAT